MIEQRWLPVGAHRERRPSARAYFALGTFELPMLLAHSLVPIRPSATNYTDYMKRCLLKHHEPLLRRQLFLQLGKPIKNQSTKRCLCVQSAISPLNYRLADTFSSTASGARGASEPDAIYVGLRSRSRVARSLQLKISTGERTLIRQEHRTRHGLRLRSQGPVAPRNRSAENGDTEVLRVDADKFTKV
jgi:hypothetical protein